MQLAGLVDAHCDGLALMAGPGLVAVFDVGGAHHARVAVAPLRSALVGGTPFGQIGEAGFQRQQMRVELRRLRLFLDALKAEMNETTGRWSWARQLYGHVYTAMRGTLGVLQAFGATRNDQHATVFGLEPGVGECDYEYVAARVARESALLSAMVARPTQTGEVTGVLAPLAHQRFTLTERNTLLSSGIATHYSGKDGVVRIERSITTYQKNAWGSADTSYLDSENLHQLAYVMRYLRTGVTSIFGRMALRSDGQRVPNSVATPSMLKAQLVSDYGVMERLGIVEQTDLFAANLVVEIDATNPNRVNVLYPPDLVNQLRIFAVLNQFRLNY